MEAVLQLAARAQHAMRPTRPFDNIPVLLEQLSDTVEALRLYPERDLYAAAEEVRQAVDGYVVAFGIQDAEAQTEALVRLMKWTDELADRFLERST